MNINRLKEIREDKDLHQKDIAKILSTSQVQYSRYKTLFRFPALFGNFTSKNEPNKLILTI